MYLLAYHGLEPQIKELDAEMEKTATWDHGRGDGRSADGRHGSLIPGLPACMCWCLCLSVSPCLSLSFSCRLAVRACVRAAPTVAGTGAGL